MQTPARIGWLASRGNCSSEESGRFPAPSTTVFSHRSSNQSKKRKEIMKKLITRLSAVLVAAFAASAFASSHHPKGEFEEFGECPLDGRAPGDLETILAKADRAVSSCVFSVANSTLQEWFNPLGRNCYFGSDSPVPSVPHGLKGDRQQQPMAAIHASGKEVTHSNCCADSPQCSFA
jgi:hypothetical protein